MRSVIVISLLILFTSSQVGYYCVYSFQQNEIKNEIKERFKTMLPESSLQIIVAEEHAKALQWEEEGKEFLLYGELYDVAKIKMVNGKTLLYCLNDKNEEKLLHEFAKAIKSATNNSDNNKNTKSNYKFQLSDYYFFKATEKAAVIITSAVCQHLFFISSLTSSVKEVNAPPPRV